MSIKIPKPPRLDMLFTQSPTGLILNQGVMRDLRIYLENLGKIFENNSASIAWSSIGFSGSKLSDIETRRHGDLQNIEQVDVAADSTDRTKHLSDALAKGWETHKGLTTTAHGGIVADSDARLTDARTPLGHDNAKHTTAYQATSEKGAAGGYASLSASSRVEQGTDTTDDVIIDIATKGVVLKDTQVTPHYWRVGITAGALAVADLGTVKP